MSAVKRYSRVNALRSAFDVARVWLVVVLAMVLAIRSGHPLAYAGAMLVIALQQHSLQILLHEAAHYLMFENRTLNDLVSDVFTAFPLGVATSLYRHTHISHHRHINSEHDPDIAFWEAEPAWKVWPKSRAALAAMLIKSALGLNMHKTAHMMRRWSPLANLRSPLGISYPVRARISFVLFLLALAALATLLGKTSLQVALLWFVPGATLTNVISRFRACMEHMMTENAQELTATRTVLPSTLERLLIAPMGVNFHLEHHLFPSVPYRNLHRLHGELMADAHYRAKAPVVHGYANVLRGWLRDGKDPQRAI